MGMRTEKNERRRFKRKTQEENYIPPNFFPPFDLFFHHFDAVFSLISLSFLTTKYGFSQVFYIKEALSMSLTRFRGKCSINRSMLFSQDSKVPSKFRAPDITHLLLTESNKRSKKCFFLKRSD